MSLRPVESSRFPTIAVLLILTAAFLIRINALWLPHWRGDQAQYVILAMKLSKQGLDGYNLRAVAMGTVNASSSKENRLELNAVKLADRDTSGAYLTLMKSIGQSYYDEPLHMRAPLFPALLAWSHHLFSGIETRGRPVDPPPFAVLSYGPKTFTQAMASWKVWRYQLWAALPPLIFNLGLIFLSAVLAWVLFGSRWITITTAAVLAGNPVSIWLAHKVLTENVAVFFVTASVLAFTLLWKRSRAAAGLAAGVLAGAATLTNQRMGLLLPVIACFAFLSLWRDAASPPGSGRWIAAAVKLVKMVLDRFFWLFGAGFLAVTGFWFARVIRTYGHPLHQPDQQMNAAVTSDVTGWFAAVHARPHPLILFTVGVVALCPIFIFAIGTWTRSWDGWIGRKKDSQSRSLTFLWIWTATFFLQIANFTALFNTGNQEHRYFYPVYPAISILTAVGYEHVRQWWELRLRKPRLVNTLAASLLVMNAWWGCRLAYPQIFSDQMLF